MVKFTLTFIFTLFTLFAIGQQNLVPNPSFEEHSACPDSPGDIELATPWFQPSILNSSSDLFDECSVSSLVGVPMNITGFQNARTGKSYGGIVFWEMGFDMREYIEIGLSKSLKKGKKYCVEFYVSLCDTSNYGIANIGAYFSIDSILYDPLVNMVLPYTPQIINSNGSITDKNSWIRISGEFVSNGGERFMTIGNFYSNANTTTQFIGDSGDTDGAYYYIDDVSVTCCDENGCEALLDGIPNVFTPNGDGVNDAFTIEAPGIENISCEIFNRWGIKVSSFSNMQASAALSLTIWDGRTTSGEEAVEGVYYYVITARSENGEQIRKTGFVQLLR